MFDFPLSNIFHYPRISRKDSQLQTQFNMRSSFDQKHSVFKCMVKIVFKLQRYNNLSPVIVIVDVL